MLICSLIGLLLIERLGRRKLMIWTSVLMGATFIILAGLYDTVATSTAAQVISVLCLFLFNTWFSIGWLGMTWLYPAEVTPLRIRAPANALSTASNWLFNFFGKPHFLLLLKPLIETHGPQSSWSLDPCSTVLDGVLTPSLL